MLAIRCECITALQVIWVDLLTKEEFEAGFGSHTPIYSGQTKCVRYYMNFDRGFALLKSILAEVFTPSNTPVPGIMWGSGPGPKLYMPEHMMSGCLWHVSFSQRENACPCSINGTLAGISNGSPL
jgi:hypothetical protein